MWALLLFVDDLVGPLEGLSCHAPKVGTIRNVSFLIASILGGMSETSGRLLSLLSLLQTPREWPGPELADRLHVTTRTVRNDVERLRTLGYPVEATRGPIGGYRLVAGTAMPPLLLEDEEAVAVAVSLRTASGGAVSGMEESALRALTKLQQVLPKRLGLRVDALQSHTARVAPYAAARPSTAIC